MLLASSMVFLAVAVIAVPLFQKLKIGAILGYLVAGAVIGPSLLNWISNPDVILHFAELGVVLMLFVIGLELEPEKLWKMRHNILLSGSGQLLTSSLLIAAACAFFLGFNATTALVISLSLALSSTAFAIQLMKEQTILNTPPGQQGFSILLMQDIAVIPILLLVAHLAPNQASDSPAWWMSVAAVIAALVAGRFLVNPLLRLVSTHGSTESMTAAALLIVLATATGLEAAGLSMGLGAFIAGIMLANSSYRHQLETEIEPFKGLLLGLFFIAIGMNLNLSLLVENPGFILACAVLLMLIKATVIFTILRLNRQASTDAMRVGLMLSQGGEFAFVVMTQAAGSGLLDPAIASEVTLVVGLSMALTSPVVIVQSLFFNSRNCPAVYDTEATTHEPGVIIAGFGRFGQISGRILRAHHIPFTALETDAQHIDFVSRFGNKVFYGDASRLDLLRTAGIDHARTFLIAVDDEQTVLTIAALVSREYPDIQIIARARNRATVRKLHAMGVTYIVRELFGSSLEAASYMMMEQGYTKAEADYITQTFAEHDQTFLARSLEKELTEAELIEYSERSRNELRDIFQQDVGEYRSR